jgi:RNA polymerase sigma factor (sigma-70 family)
MTGDDFERLYAEHGRALLGFLVYRTGDRPLAEDIAADTFERAMRRRSLFDRRRGDEKSWLYAIALNLLRDHARRADAERRALERAAAGSAPASVDTDPGIERAEQRDELGRALAQLSDGERDLIALKFGAGLSVAEIAALWREKPSAVESRLYRSLRRLRVANSG